MWKRIKHLFGRHDYKRVRRINSDTHLLECKICKRWFVMNTKNKCLLDWDLEFLDMFVCLGCYDEKLGWKE